jgi:hypothetical protein
LEAFSDPAGRTLIFTKELGINNLDLHKLFARSNYTPAKLFQRTTMAYKTKIRTSQKAGCDNLYPVMTCLNCFND